MTERTTYDDMYESEPDYDVRGNRVVAEQYACPRCEEYRMDWLTWDSDGERVTCESCGMTYDPNGE